MPSNQEYLQVFENDEYLKYFIENKNEDEDDGIALVRKNCVQSESIFTRYDHTKSITK